MFTFLLNCKHPINQHCCSTWFQATAMCKEQLLANNPTHLPFRAPPLALSGQMPSYFIFLTEHLRPQVWLKKSHHFSLSLWARSNFSFLLQQSHLIEFWAPVVTSHRHLPRLRLCKMQMQLWGCAGRNGQRQPDDRQGCYSKIRLESEVLSVSVNQGAAKWLKPSISAPSEGSEILLHDS